MDHAIRTIHAINGQKTILAVVEVDERRMVLLQ